MFGDQCFNHVLGESLLRKRLHQVDFSSNNGDVCDSEGINITSLEC